MSKIHLAWTMMIYKTWILREFWLDKNLRVIVLVNSYKNNATGNCCIKAIDLILCGFTGVIKPTWDLGEHLKILYITRLRLVIYRLFSCRLKIPRGCIRLVTPLKCGLLLN